MCQGANHGCDADPAALAEAYEIPKVDAVKLIQERLVAGMKRGHKLRKGGRFDSLRQLELPIEVFRAEEEEEWP